MAGKNKGGREIRKPKAAQPKKTAAQPSRKGAVEVPAEPVKAALGPRH